MAFHHLSEDLEALSRDLRTRVEPILSALSPLLEQLELERLRIAPTARVASLLGMLATSAVLMGIVAGLLAFLVGFLYPRWEDLLFTAAGALAILGIPMFLLVWILEAILHRTSFYVRYRRELLPRILEGLGLEYQELTKDYSPDLFGSAADFLSLVRARFPANHVVWQVLLTPRKARSSLAIAQMQLLYRTRGARSTVFQGLVAVTRIPRMDPAIEEILPSPGMDGPLVIRRADCVYAFVPCEVDLLHPDAAESLPQKGLDNLRRWLWAAAEALEQLSRR
ncbi:MAG: hypothetical protein N0A24_09885 [Armatimonadetes bacterium]|nr:hypothetical protein [Armatimonadota bacterium]MDW8154488.1 hypothetical protein [Armatimonadota bacterium]